MNIGNKQCTATFLGGAFGNGKADAGTGSGGDKHRFAV